MTRALVLGATGHIGAHVVRALLGKGYAVRASYRNPRYRFVLDGLPVERVHVDVEDPRQLRAALDGCELVFVCAGYYPRFTDRHDEAIRRGIEQVRRICDVLNACPVSRIVYTSSTATIAPVSGRPATEHDQEPWPLTHWSPHLFARRRCAIRTAAVPPQAGRPPPVGRREEVGGWRPLYASVKIAMEHTVERYAREGLPMVIVNPSVCLGEYDAHLFSGRLILLFGRTTRRSPVYLHASFNAVYTGDVGVGHVLAAERGVPGERYLLTGENLSLGELARRVAREAKVPPPRWCIPYSLAMAAATMTELAAWLTRTDPLLPRRAIHSARLPQCLDGSKARRELGLPQTPIDEAIRRALAWFRQHGYL